MQLCVFVLTYVSFCSSLFVHVVLAAKGIDASLVDKRVEQKAHVPRLTGKLQLFAALIHCNIYDHCHSCHILYIHLLIYIFLSLTSLIYTSYKKSSRSRPPSGSSSKGTHRSRRKATRGKRDGTPRGRISRHRRKEAHGAQRFGQGISRIEFQGKVREGRGTKGGSRRGCSRRKGGRREVVVAEEIRKALGTPS